MLESNQSLSLTRRLLASYLMFALAGLLACILATVYLATRDELLEFTPVVLVVPLGIVVLGAHSLRQLVRVYTHIDQQLRILHSSPSPSTTALATLPESLPQARAWNQLVRQLQDTASLSDLDSRLSAAFSTLHEQTWQPLFNSLPEGIVACDGLGRVTRANLTALTMLNLASEAEILGNGFLDLLATRLPAEAARSLDDLRRSGVAERDLHLGAETTDGVWRVARLPLVGEQVTQGAVWTFRDVTQRKLAEQSRNQFVFTAAHELRTPLANIKAYAETLATQDRIDVEQQRGFYNIINAEATRLARFVDDLLDVSQMQTGSAALQVAETDVERLLHEVVEHVAPQIKQKQMRFQSSLPPKCPTLRADKDKLSAALLNLIGNALKYTDPGGLVRLEVQADSAQIHFRVEDNGFGIAPDDISKLCQKFFRSNDGRVRAIGGSGLGLAFTQEVARLHGGSLTIQSELNKGSLFTMSLPLA